MGYLYALAAAVLFGAGGSVIKVILGAGLSPAQITLFRVLGTSVIAGVFLLVADRKALKVTWRQLLILAALGVSGVAVLQFTYAIAITVLPVGITLLFEYLSVLLVALVAFFAFKEEVKRRLWAAIGCVLVGLAFVAQVWDSQLDPFGVLMAFSAMLCLAIYFLVGERAVNETSPMAVTFWTMSSASVFWLIFSGWWQIDPALFTTSVSLTGNLDWITVPFWALVAWIVVFGSFTPYLLEFFALQRLTATAAGVVASAEVVFAFAVAWLWLGESLNLMQTLGATVVLVGIVLAQTARIDKVVNADLALLDTASIPIQAPKR